MENPPFEDVFPIQDGDFPLLCLFTGGYVYESQYIHLGKKRNSMIYIYIYTWYCMYTCKVFIVILWRYVEWLDKTAYLLHDGFAHGTRMMPWDRKGSLRNTICRSYHTSHQSRYCQMANRYHVWLPQVAVVRTLVLLILFFVEGWPY